MALKLVLNNPGTRPAQFTLAALAYQDGTPRNLRMAPGAKRVLRLPLAEHHWYDWRVALADAPGTAWRFAGHLEDGRPSLTDPAMHGPARLRHDSGVPQYFRA